MYYRQQWLETEWQMFCAEHERLNTVLAAESPSEASRSPLPFQRLSSQVVLSWPTRRKTLNETAADKMDTTTDGNTPAGTVAAPAAAPPSESTTMPPAPAAVVESKPVDPRPSSHESDQINVAVKAEDAASHPSYLSETGDRQDDTIRVASPSIDGPEINVAVTIENGDTTEAIQPADTAEAEDDVDEPEHGIFILECIINHRPDPDDPTLLQMRVCWTHDKPTWEPESSIQEDAGEALFAYWDTVEGGRAGAMADKNLWHVLKVEKHKQEASGTVKLRVVWVRSLKLTWEPEEKVIQCAPELVDDYWTTKGGRQKHIKAIDIPVKRRRRRSRKTTAVEDQVTGAEESADTDEEPPTKRGRGPTHKNTM
ncbi:putative chromo domain-containing protein [Colletotrichum kahawae]|uniref:Chromo domain-containing protein n=1 Tax=Colletotrichum kahawae TaxID=34407 RepID=A0AAD9XVI5_COLKA|nr:putative chromo domain-containing protein [Colletotrichum kahawae]